MHRAAIMNRPKYDALEIRPKAYDRALQNAVSWLGDRYLLAVPQSRLTAEQPKYWTAQQHAAAHQSRQTRR
jgi:hypothetical protein